MAYMITAQCIVCAACEFDCPVRAITQSANQYVIDPDVCVECSGYFPEPRCAATCPVDACVPARDEYLWRASSLSARGGKPTVLTSAVPSGTQIAVG